MDGMKIGLLVSESWFKRSKSTRVISDYLKQRDIECEECCWESTKEWRKYDTVLICSTWGYQNEYQRYLEVLFEIEKETLLLNPLDIISDNIYKDKQIQLLRKYCFPIISTVFLSQESEAEGVKTFQYSSDMNLISLMQHELHGKEFVLKPSISASGNDTVVFSKNLLVKNGIFTEEGLKQYCQMVFAKIPNAKIMIQPFVREIENGEYALIYINKHFSHAVRRYPGVLGIKKRAEVIEELSEDVLELGNKVNNLIWKKGMLYMRVDLVGENTKMKIMEIECNEPELYFYRLDGVERGRALRMLVDWMLEMSKNDDVRRG